MALQTRVLGKTGRAVTVFGLGTGAFGFSKVPHEAGVGFVRRALDLGVTYFDTAHYYESELMVGEGLEGRRSGVFLTTKTIKRNRDAAWRDLEKSLRDLRTDHVDLLIQHCVNAAGDVDAILSPGGSVEALVEAKRQGLAKFIGISGHARPNVLADAIERGPFDVVMPALGIMDTMVTSPEKYLLPAVQRTGVGLVAMKVLGSGRLAKHGNLAIRYALGLGAHTAVVGIESLEQLELAVENAQNPAPLSEVELATLTAAARIEVVGRENPPYWLTDHEVLAYKEGWVGAKL